MRVTIYHNPCSAKDSARVTPERPAERMVEIL
jgi:hypothetical protein